MKEVMYLRFQTLVSGLQILMKSYVASNHVNKILRSLPSKWRPKVTTIVEAKDLNTLSHKDLISSLKCHEIGLNEQEHVRKPKSIALKSKRKTSKALKKNLKMNLLLEVLKKIQKLKRWLCSLIDFSIWL